MMRTRRELRSRSEVVAVSGAFWIAGVKPEEVL
jgi:hypothetical protein